MKRHFKSKFFLLGVLICIQATAMAGDLNVMIKPINPFIFSSRQIYSPISILNIGSTNVEISVTVSLLNREGITLSEYRSVGFEVKPGNTDLSITSPTVLSAHYNNIAFREYEQLNAAFPAGNYQYCVDLIYKATGSKERFCDDFDIQGMNPATLLYPENESNIDHPEMIQFSWVPCTPPRSKIFYSFKLVELYKNQEPTEAIKRNPAIHQVSGLSSSLYVYPADAQKLKRGKEYAWQVECYEDLSEPELQAFSHSAVSSEVHEFAIGKKRLADTVLYATPKRVMDASFVTLKEGKVYFTFQSEYIQGKLDYSFIDRTRKEIPIEIHRVNEDGSISDSPIVLKGENRYELVLDKGYPADGIYTLEIHDLKGITYFLRIKITNA